MKHEFTDTDIGLAGASAALKGGVAPTPVSTNFLKRFLDHLPDPDDEWQECEFEDIQAGDRVRLVLKNGPLTDSPTIIEAEPHVAKAHYLAWSRHRTGSTIEASDVQAVYRIPKPVTTPDPAEHSVILVRQAGVVSHNAPAPYIWTGDVYASLDGPLNHCDPDEITDWEPADIVPKAVASNA